MPDAPYMADVLLASLAPELVLYQRNDGRTLGQLRGRLRNQAPTASSSTHQRTHRNPPRRTSACTLAQRTPATYPRAVRNGFTGSVDRRLESLIVVWVRRRWPLLRLVPARWIRPATAPAAARLRRALSRAVLVVGVSSALVVALLGLMP